MTSIHVEIRAEELRRAIGPQRRSGAGLLMPSVS